MPRKFTFTTQVYDKRTDFPATGDVDVIYIDASKNTAYRYDESYYTISSAEVDIWGAMGSLSKGGGGGGGASWGSISGTLSNQTDLQTALDAKQDDLVSGTNIKTVNSTSLLGSGNIAVQPTLSLTTTGTSGAATLVGATLNIPQYSGGSGGGGFNAEIPLGSGGIYSNIPIGNSSGNMNIGANNLYLMPFKPSVTFTTLNIFANIAVVGTGDSRLLLYSHSDTTGLPDTKLFESVNISNTTLGIKTITTTLTFTAGTIYWFGIYSSSSVQFVGSGTAGLFQIGVDSSNSQYQNIQRSGVTFGTAPATFGTTHLKTQLPFVRIGLTAV